MAKQFELKTAKDGQVFFNLKAANGQIILSSEMYKTKDGALNGISSVKKNATIPERYERLTSHNGKYYFTLNAANSQVIGNSELYDSASSRDKGIDAVMQCAPSAEVVEIGASA